MSVRDNASVMSAALSKKEISAVELTNQHYEQIAADLARASSTRGRNLSAIS